MSTGREKFYGNPKLGDPLSKEQIDVLDRLARGQSPQIVAAAHQITPSGLSRKLLRARIKLGAKTNYQAVGIYVTKLLRDNSES